MKAIRIHAHGGPDILSLKHPYQPHHFHRPTGAIHRDRSS